MTDREKLLVALLSETDDVPERGPTAVEVMAMLDALGADHRMWRELAEHAPL